MLTFSNTKTVLLNIYEGSMEIIPLQASARWLLKVIAGGVGRFWLDLQQPDPCDPCQKNADDPEPRLLGIDPRAMDLDKYCSGPLITANVSCGYCVLLKRVLKLVLNYDKNDALPVDFMFFHGLKTVKIVDLV